MALGRKPIEIVNAGKHQLLVKAKDWKRINLAEVAKVQNGFAFSSTHFVKSGGMPLIRIRDIDRTSTIDRYIGKYSDEFIVKRGDVLVGMDGDFKAAIWKGENALLNQRVCRIIPFSTEYDPRFLFLCLQPYLNAINEETSSVTVKHLSSKTIEEIPLPYPKLEVQKAIVSKIEELFSELDKGIEQLKTAQQQLKTYRQSALSAATSGMLTHTSKDYLNIISIGRPVNTNKNWTVVKLIDVAKLESGHTPRKDTPEYWENGDVLWLSLQDIRLLDGKIAINTKYKTNKLGIENSSARLLPKGTVCFCRDISVGFVTIMGKVMSTTQHFANWICSEVLNNKFLMYSFMACRDSLIRHGQGTTVKTIYMPELKEMRILLPPIEEQLTIVATIERCLTVADKMEESISQSLQQSEALRQSILKRAFEGKLI